MALKFHWMLPKGGEMTHQETARVLTTSNTSLAGKPDMAHWIDFAQQAEQAGIDSLLLSFGNYEPDTLQVACALGCVTNKIKFIVAYRMGLMQPTLFVQQVNTLSNLIDGRFSLNIIAGSSVAEQRGYGDYLEHDDRYARAEEYLAICHDFWRNNEPVTFAGKHCQLEGGRIHTPYIAPEGASNHKAPEIFVSGHSKGAEQLALNQGTCWLRLIDTPEKLLPLVERARACGKEMCLRLSIICRNTKEEALLAAEALKEGGDTTDKVRSFFKASDSQFLKDAMTMADESEWLNQYLWAGLVPSYGPSVVALVGTPEELAQAFMDYKRIGISQFIISGWPKLDEMMFFGREVLPLIRKAELDNDNYQSITP
ncbi:MAG: LLM class flavin-dependent oxidoreductase [Algicola sp.]|nr:LLM class flavin-dependent oxidoreductase [Algicola sp.]